MEWLIPLVKLEETMSHLTGAVYAMMPGEVNLHRGTQMAGIIRDEQKHDPRRGFAAGYELETLPAFGLWGFASYSKPGGWGRQYASDIENYRNVAGLWIVGEDMPQKNRITLHDTKKDQYGLPIPSVNYKDHPNDTAMKIMLGKQHQMFIKLQEQIQFIQECHFLLLITWELVDKVQKPLMEYVTVLVKRMTLKTYLFLMEVSSLLVLAENPTLQL